MVTITAGAGELCFHSEVDLLACLERLHRSGAVPIKRTESQYHIMFEWYGVTIKISK